MVVKIKKTKYTKKCVIKRKLEVENYQNYLEATQFENKIDYLQKKIELTQIVLKKIIRNL